MSVLKAQPRQLISNIYIDHSMFIGSEAVLTSFMWYICTETHTIKCPHPLRINESHGKSIYSFQCHKFYISRAMLIPTGMR